MELFVHFISDEKDAELVLFLYGFLEGFDGITKDEQYNAYYNYARIYNPRINKRRKNKGSLLREVGKKTIQQLSETVATTAFKSEGKLNFADEVYEKFSNNYIPETLSLPITNYFNMKSMLQKDAIDDRSLSPKIDKSDYIDCEIEDVFPQQTSISYESESSIENEAYSEDKIAEDSNATDDVGVQPSSRKRSFVSQGSFEKCLIIFLIMILGIVTIILALNIKEHSFEKEAILGENNFKEDDNLEVKSIEIKNKYILLYPEQSTDLIVIVDPSEISAEELDYTSSVPTVATAKKTTITANKDWIEDECHETIITVQGGGIVEDKAYVTVRKTDFADSAIGYGENNMNSDDDNKTRQLGE